MYNNLGNANIGAYITFFALFERVYIYSDIYNIANLYLSEYTPINIFYI